MIYQIKKNIKEKTERKLIEAATKKINDSESAYIEPVDMFFSYSMYLPGLITSLHNAFHVKTNRSRLTE